MIAKNIHDFLFIFYSNEYLINIIDGNYEFIIHLAVVNVDLKKYAF